LEYLVSLDLAKSEGLERGISEASTVEATKEVNRDAAQVFHNNKT